MLNKSGNIDQKKETCQNAYQAKLELAWTTISYDHTHGGP